MEEGEREKERERKKRKELDGREMISEEKECCEQAVCVCVCVRVKHRPQRQMEFGFRLLRMKPVRFHSSLLLSGFAEAVSTHTHTCK